MLHKKLAKQEIQPGTRFGKWTVLSPGENNLFYKCQCDCGKIRSVNVKNLKSGRSKSCGTCCRINDASIIGNKYGHLTALERSDRYYLHKNTGYKEYLIKCQCDCGNITYIAKTPLTHNRVQSCGCIQKKEAAKRTDERMIGKKYGKLTIIGRAENRYYESCGIVPVWLCKCECGNTTKATGYNLKSGSVKSCGCAKRKWTQEEEDLVMNSDMTNKEIANKINKTVSSVYAKRCYLKKKAQFA